MCYRKEESDDVYECPQQVWDHYMFPMLVL
jgi:hypothetical protein